MREIDLPDGISAKQAEDLLKTDKVSEPEFRRGLVEIVGAERVEEWGEDFVETAYSFPEAALTFLEAGECCCQVCSPGCYANYFRELSPKKREALTLLFRYHHDPEKVV